MREVAQVISSLPFPSARKRKEVTTIDVNDSRAQVEYMCCMYLLVLFFFFFGNMFILGIISFDYS